MCVREPGSGPGWLPGTGPQSRAGTFSARRALAVSPLARAKLLAGLGTNWIIASSVSCCPAPSPDLNLPPGPRCAPRPSRVRGRTAGKCNFLRLPRFQAPTPLGPVWGDRLLPLPSLCGSAKFSRGRAAWQTLRSCHPLIISRRLAAAPAPPVELGHWGSLRAGLVPWVPAAAPGVEPHARVTPAYAEASLGPADGSRCYRVGALATRACRQLRTSQLEFLLTSRGSKRAFPNWGPVLNIGSNLKEGAILFQ